MKYGNKRLFLVSICLFPVTVYFTFLVMSNSFNSTDQLVQRFFTTWSSPVLEKLMNGMTFLAKTDMLAFLSVVTVIWLSSKKLFNLVFLYLLIMGGGVIITFLMKISIERDRPGEIFFVDFWGFGKDLISYSYPSGHAAKGLLFFGFLIFWVQIGIKKRPLKSGLIVLFTTIIFLIGVGQIILDRHYVSDVIGGYLVALTWLAFCIFILKPLGIYREKKIGRSPPSL